MSVFERTRELGILAALGMKGRQIMTMVLLEAGTLAILGIIVGHCSGRRWWSGTCRSTASPLAMKSRVWRKVLPCAA